MSNPTAPRPPTQTPPTKDLDANKKDKHASSEPVPARAPASEDAKDGKPGTVIALDREHDKGDRAHPAPKPAPTPHKP